MNGKGDTPRPVDAKRYAENYDSINWHRPADTASEWTRACESALDSLFQNSESSDQRVERRQ